MPAVKRSSAKTKTGTRRGRSRLAVAPETSGSPAPHQPQHDDSLPPGRIRKYLPADDPGRDWSLRTAETPEGRLAGNNDADWHVPTGDEAHLRTDDGSLRLGDGATDPFAGDGAGAGVGTESKSKSRYKTDDFYVRSTNSHDHSVPWRTSITSELAQAIDGILRSEKLPFRRSREQFTAVALYELVQLSMRLEPIPDSDIAILEAMNQLNRTYQVVVGYDSMIRMKCSTMHDLVERGLKNTARVMLHETLRIIGRMKNRELREKHYKRVRTEFAGLIRDSKPVSGRAVHTTRRRT